MSEKPEAENIINNNSGSNFTIDTLNQENSSAAQETNSTEKKEKFQWQFSENVKRDSFGFILRTDPLPLNSEKSKKSDSQTHENLNISSAKGKDKKSNKSKGEDRYEEDKKSDRERGRERDRDKGRDRDRDRSPHGYKRKYSRSPSPRRSRHRRSRSRSRTPRDPRLRRNTGNAGDRDRYRYRRYSSEKSPDKDSDKSDLRNSSPRRERSRSPPLGWRGSHNRDRTGPVDPRNPSININNRPPEYTPMVPSFHQTTPSQVPAPSNTSPGTLPPVADGGTFNRYQASNAPSVSAPSGQYNYPPAPNTGAPETYPGYDVYYQGYPPPPPPSLPQPEYIATHPNNWQRDVNQPPKVAPIIVPTEDPAKKEAIEKELLQQKITLSKQRDEYLRKGIILNRELELLKAQKKDLAGDKTRDSEKLFKENNKLQLEISSKIKAVDNVIDILTGIIGDARPTIPLEEKSDGGKTTGRDSSREKEKNISREKSEKKKLEKRSKDSSESGGPSSSDDSSSDSDSEYRKKVRKSKKKKKRKTEGNDEDSAPPGMDSNLVGMESRIEETKPLCNFIYYDPEMHWCQVCDEFPRTAKEYLNHLHSKEHKELTQEKKLNDMPWHDLNVHEEIPFYEGAPTKRIPIKGLQFLVSATAWFCKLCRVWIGDLHCASLHLKSKEHSANYSSFNEQNPHWETDWMANREKAYEKCAEQRRRQRDEELLQKQKQERLELMKKQEEELKQKFYSSLMKPESSETELIMPLTLPRSFEGPMIPVKENSEGKKEKEKKKKAKKEKKKKEKRMKEKKKKAKEKKSRKSSSSESGSSSESSTDTSDSDEEKKFKKELLADLEGRSKSMRVPLRGKDKPEEERPLSIPITLPEKSKWEMDEVAESKHVPLAPPPPPPPPPEPKEVPDIKEQTSRSEPVSEKPTKEWLKVETTESEKESLKSVKEKEKSKSKDKSKDWSKSDERSSRYDKKRSYRDKRQESSNSSSRRERRSSWDRKKDYRSSRHRRSRTRSRSRSISREREREKVTPGVIPAPLYDLFKLPEKHVVVLPEAGKSDRSEHRTTETDDGESKFEKQAMEAAKKKKIQPVINLPKSKFGFIGRMPFAKKRSDSEKGGKKDDDSPKKEEEMEAPPPPRITQPRPPSPKAPKPVLTNKTKVETAKEIVSKYQKAFQEKVEEPPVPETVPCQIPVEINPPLPPSPPVLTMMSPSPPKIRESPKSPKKTKKSPYPLPKDFQDALSIIYPEEKAEDKTADGYHNAEMMAAAMSFQPAPMGYGPQMMMAYPGMHMMAAMPQMPPPHHMMNTNAMRMFNPTAPPPPSGEPETPSPPAMPPPPENLFETSFGLGSSSGVGIPGLDEDKMETSSRMSDDDMALLGIDAEDMAAQQL